MTDERVEHIFFGVLYRMYGLSSGTVLHPWSIYLLTLSRGEFFDER